MHLPERVRIHPAPLAGSVRVPGDKSLSHRALLIPALVSGSVSVAGLAASADVAATAAGLRLLGVRIDLAPDGHGGLAGVVSGPPDDDAARSAVSVAIDCGNSGTTLRLLAGLVAGTGHHVRFDGDSSLRRRPVGRVADPLRAMGAEVECSDGDRPPLRVRGGDLHGITWWSQVASAQVKSAIVLAGLRAEGSTTVVSPAPSRDHTERLLRAAGVSVVTSEDDLGREHVTVTPGRPALDRVDVARDPSAAAFWHVAAALGAQALGTPGICLNPGRVGALEVLRALGCEVTVTDRREVGGEDVGDVAVAPSALGSAVVAGDLVVRCLDELPVLALAGALSSGGLVVRDAAELRVKESDRIAAVVGSFAALGMRVEEHPDGFTVPGGQRPGAGIVHARGDHRIAMTAAIAATVGDGPVEIDGFATVASSYPGFLDDLGALGGAVEVLDGSN
jgi:3-phosphoshikimate 1-carboxyvinyltransferase